MLRTSLRPTDLRPCVLLYIIQWACTQVWCIHSSRQRTQTYNTCWNSPGLIQTPSFTTAFPDTGSESGCCSLVIQQFVSALLYMVRICACIWRTLYMIVRKLWVHINLCTKDRILLVCPLAAIMFDVTNILRIDIHTLNSAYPPHTHAWKGLTRLLPVCVYVFVCACLCICVCVAVFVHVYDFCMSYCVSVCCIFHSYRL